MTNSKLPLIPFCIAASVIIIGSVASLFMAPAKDKPCPFPDIGSPIASAMVIYDSREIQLDTRKLAVTINQSSNEANAKAEDVPLPQGGIFKLVRVKKPMGLVVVINDSPESIEEIRELAAEAEKQKLLPKESIAKLRNCNARLDVSSANNPTKVTDKAIIIDATMTDLDPANPAVQHFLHTLQGSAQGITFDCVNGVWLKP